ncbi:lysophospholipid acyltransferase family protein [Lacticaseibacillus thailandensis]|uniref:1-acyl-sn-glycerol-3-phosphate acyltransferase n=1 Tax=Lacticaseibacillus thailandensis DSM 22698 = JCM 13996 TaxID=1423810 RepID=A0A0R2CHA9_9LACO|nr:lysophospholipid acyltransferase family protein [Lacticaseibacillus thailandensis]KRM87596.1 1-acyl-sn-glycerol-3-phosphate acyltransferase [Lacticaseibacillus thailandensis DSM 22698 = JCM 13996]
MIIGGNKEAVIANIQRRVKAGEFNAKVEVGDPQMTTAAQVAIAERAIARHDRLDYRLNNLVARGAMNVAARIVNRHTHYTGMDHLRRLRGGAIITSNHFNPLENLVERRLVQKALHRRMFIVSQATNLDFPGALGFLMNYADTIPISPSTQYMARIFPDTLGRVMAAGQLVLMYSEQEMWFNYRKPRPVKRGAYYYAARLGVPIVSCFVEIQDVGRPDNDEFNQVRYVEHVLPLIYPDPALSVRMNSEQMMQQDYQQKVAAYEQAYGRPLTYDFSPDDIAGWRQPQQQS